MSDYDDSSESELNRAIALSLKDTQQNEVINLLSDDDDDDLIMDGNDNLGLPGLLNGESLADRPDVRRPGHPEAGRLRGSSATAQMESLQTADASLPVQTSSYGLTGLAGMDRKKMEEERLERARKRKAASIFPPPLSRQAARYQQPSLTSTSAGAESDRHHVKKAKVNKQSALEAPNPKEEKLSQPKQGPSEEAQAFLVSRRLAEPKPLASTGFGLKSRVNDQEATSSKDIDNTGLPNVLSYKQQRDMLAQARLKSTNPGSIQDWCLAHLGSILVIILSQHLPNFTASSSPRFTLPSTLVR
jgi:hypothetical protein